MNGKNDENAEGVKPLNGVFVGSPGVISVLVRCLFRFSPPCAVLPPVSTLATTDPFLVKLWIQLGSIATGAVLGQLTTPYLEELALVTSYSRNYILIF